MFCNIKKTHFNFGTAGRKNVGGIEREISKDAKIKCGGGE